MTQKSTTLLGVRIDNVTRGETLEHIIDAVEDGVSQYIVTPNPAIVLQAHKDAALRRALNASSLSLPDGTGVVLASYLTNQPLRRRVTGADLSIDIAREAAERGWRIGLWSPNPKTAHKAITVLSAAFLGFDGVVVEDGNVTRDVDVLLVALGAPHQEKWMHLFSSKKPATVTIGVGGALDFIAGVRPRAPRGMRLVGLEWLWRLALEPHRHWPRIIRSLIVFPWKLLRYKNESPSSS